MARPRKPGVRRSRNGRAMPPGPREKPADATLAARARHTGLPPIKAMDALAASVAGLLRLSNRITSDQYDSCQWYGGVIRRHAVVMGYPGHILREMGIDAGNGPSLVAEDADEVRRIKSTYHSLCASLANLGGRVICTVGDLALDRLPLAQAQTSTNIAEITSGLNTILRFRQNARK